MRAFQPLGPGERRVPVGDGVWEIVKDPTPDEIDYVGLQADLDELEATDPAVTAAAQRYDEAVQRIIDSTTSVEPKCADRPTREALAKLVRRKLWADVNAAADRVKAGTGTEDEYFDAFRKWRVFAVGVTPDPSPDEKALAELLWDANAESMGWLDCFKNAQVILAAGWTPPPTSIEEWERKYYPRAKP